ncbi:MAG TPA: hypothetical protein VJ183_03330 [Chloroflexia bacterium]|nr:hypothetical protein [Chloroflexia bacterium]
MRQLVHLGYLPDLHHMAPPIRALVEYLSEAAVVGCWSALGAVYRSGRAVIAYQLREAMAVCP